MNGRVRLAALIAVLTVTATAATACTEKKAEDAPTASAPASAQSTTASAASGSAPSSAEPSSTAPSPELSNVVAEPFDQRRALATAQAEAPKAAIVRIETSPESDPATIAFTLRKSGGKSLKVTLDSFSGVVLSVEPVATPRLAGEAAPTVSAKEALDQAFAQVSHGVVRSLTLTGTKAAPVWVAEVDSSEGAKTFDLPAN